ncbi:hypothetical protein GCM10010123_20670 [Pilimelia anulata]|uniref:D-glucuronyl C5-epimerase C-terminal domain-containing protein n=2 Tax=Pilimelia anulata TaxID=53371 RepID=A0A8J3B9U6_9ACTN|nr:hypothetical protein GCM10010123_20670 [Pilimelia anulata]
MVTNEAEVGLPPLPAGRRAAWEMYRIAFLPDGYPGRRTDDRVVPHPLYGTYVVNGYLARHAETGDAAYLAGARRVADAALARMAAHADALVFRYEPGALNDLPNEYFSCLTQARYVAVLGKLHAATGDPRYAEATAAVLRSLRIPVERGGVARAAHGGVVLEEYAHPAPDYTLNGWTTATVLVGEHAERTGDPFAAELHADSVRALAAVLPLYDVPELANSRYRLGGYGTLQLEFTAPGARIADAAVVLPGHGTHPVAPAGGTDNSRFLAHVAADGAVDGHTALLQAFLCRLTWPAPNRFTATVTVPAAARLTVRIGQAPYRPAHSWVQPTGYADLATVELAPGANAVDVPIPWTSAELVAYPTNFNKRIAGRRYNVYHFIHVDTLTALHRSSGDEMIGYHARRWADYPNRWPELPVYAAAGVELARFDPAAPPPAAPAPGPAAAPVPRPRMRARLRRLVRRR